MILYPSILFINRNYILPARSLRNDAAPRVLTLPSKASKAKLAIYTALSDHKPLYRAAVDGMLGSKGLPSRATEHLYRLSHAQFAICRTTIAWIVDTDFFSWAFSELFSLHADIPTYGAGSSGYGKSRQETPTAT